jgi:hypothetical protein
MRTPLLIFAEPSGIDPPRRRSVYRCGASLEIDEGCACYEPLSAGYSPRRSTVRGGADLRTGELTGTPRNGVYHLKVTI